MVECDSGWSLGPNIYMARRAFKCDVLRILMSDFHEGHEKHTLGIKERSCASAMSVVIMRTKHDWWTDSSRDRFS